MRKASDANRVARVLRVICANSATKVEAIAMLAQICVFFVHLQPVPQELRSGPAPPPGRISEHLRTGSAKT